MPISRPPEVTLPPRVTSALFDDPWLGCATRFALDRTGALGERTVLDLGCGEGEASVYFAAQGARVIGTDRRVRALERSRLLAREAGVADRCSFVGALSECLPLASGSIDVVLSRSTLQYSDRRRALAECLRVLRPGGTMVLIENLDRNPFVRGYRKLRASRASTAEEVAYVRSIRGYPSLREVTELRTEFEDFTHPPSTPPGSWRWRWRFDGRVARGRTPRNA